VIAVTSPAAGVQLGVVCNRNSLCTVSLNCGASSKPHCDAILGSERGRIRRNQGFAEALMGLASLPDFYRGGVTRFGFAGPMALRGSRRCSVEFFKWKSGLRRGFD
jgi:hypothetical protein